MTENKDNNNDDNIEKFPDSPWERQRYYQKKQLEKKPIYLQEPANEQIEPIFNIPNITKNLALLLISVHIVLKFVSIKTKILLMSSLAFIPAKYTGGLDFDFYALISPVTYALLHSSWMHLAVNTGMLLAFGSGVEKKLGSKKMLFLFIISVVAGAFLHFIIYSNSLNPVIGASGGISGLFAAMLVIMNHEMGSKRNLVLLVAIWLSLSLFFGATGDPVAGSNVAWAAHIGGFFAGLAISLKWLKKDRAG